MKVLVVAPHADDETLGMGGTIARLADEGHEVTIALMTGPGDGAAHPIVPRAAFDRVRDEFKRACDLLGARKTIIKNLPTVLVSDLPQHVVNEVTKSVVEEVDPESLFVPFAYDLHQDHRAFFHSFSIHWRSYLPMGRRIREVWCYETPSETHLGAPSLEPAFSPNLHVDISRQLERKIAALKIYESQKQPAPLPRSPEAIDALARFRGSQIGVAAAEAFVLVRRID